MINEIKGNDCILIPQNKDLKTTFDDLVPDAIKIIMKKLELMNRVQLGKTCKRCWKYLNSLQSHKEACRISLIYKFSLERYLFWKKKKFSLDPVDPILWKSLPQALSIQRIDSKQLLSFCSSIHHSNNFKKLANILAHPPGLSVNFYAYPILPNGHTIFFDSVAPGYNRNLIMYNTKTDFLLIHRLPTSDLFPMNGKPPFSYNLCGEILNIFGTTFNTSLSSFHLPSCRFLGQFSQDDLNGIAKCSKEERVTYVNVNLIDETPIMLLNYVSLKDGAQKLVFKHK